MKDSELLCNLEYISQLKKIYIAQLKYSTIKYIARKYSTIKKKSNKEKSKV